MQDAHVQFPALFRFRDYVEARFIPLPGRDSTNAVYPRPTDGGIDPGVDRKRIHDRRAERPAETGGAQ
jgi:hypothetical protein